MRKSIKEDASRPATFAFPAEASAPMEELIRQGARQIIQQVIEAEMQALLLSYAHVTAIGGQRVVGDMIVSGV